MTKRACGRVRRKKWQRGCLTRISGHFQCVDLSKEDLGIAGVNSLNNVEISFSSETSEQINNVVLLQQLLMRSDVRDVDSVKIANDVSKA